VIAEIWFVVATCELIDLLPKCIQNWMQLEILIQKTIFLEFKLQSLKGMRFDYLLYLDWVAISFISVVLLISSAVFFYRRFYINYISDIKFITLVTLFVSSIGLIVLSPNLLRIILGWDGLGLVSYLLVIYYNNVRSILSGLITIIRNRFGDIALIFSLIFLIKGGAGNIMFIDLFEDYKEFFFFSYF